MANELSASQGLLFRGPTVDMEKIQIEGSINESGFPAGSDVDITARVNAFGRCQITAWNANPRRSNAFDFPRMAWTVRNDDGYFTPGHANEVWNAKVPQFWQMKYKLGELDTNPASVTNVLYFHFDILEVQLTDELAVLIGVHQLSRMWAKRWSRSDRREVDWTTNAVGHSMVL